MSDEDAPIQTTTNEDEVICNKEVDWQIHEKGNVWTTVNRQLATYLETSYQQYLDSDDSKYATCNYAIERNGQKHFYRMYMEEMFQQNLQTGFLRKSRRCALGSNTTLGATPEEKIKMAAKITEWKEVPFEDLQDPKEKCSICIARLKPKNEDEEKVADTVVHLSKCMNHFFHKECIVQCFKIISPKNGCLECPNCKYSYGIKMGTMPVGIMKVHETATHLPGYEGCGTIEITYYFPQGIQGPEHEHCGELYSGTVRTCYLPNNPEGKAVLEKLTIAFKRRLTFRIGTSVTSGRDNTVVWNGIHHKTSSHGGAANFGYPDDTYLERVTAELASFGIE